MGGEVPKSYYFSGKPETTNKKSLTVSSGSKEHLEFKIEHAGAVLKYISKRFFLKRKLFTIYLKQIDGISIQRTVISHSPFTVKREAN